MVYPVVFFTDVQNSSAWSVSLDSYLASEARVKQEDDSHYDERVSSEEDVVFVGHNANIDDAQHEPSSVDAVCCIDVSDKEPEETVDNLDDTSVDSTKSGAHNEPCQNGPKSERAHGNGPTTEAVFVITNESMGRGTLHHHCLVYKYTE